MNKPISINDVNIEPGEAKEIILNIARLPTYTDIDLPVLVYRSTKPGPTLLLVACIHGDEINGVEIIRRIIANKTIIPDAGTVIAIPVVNIYAFIHSSRAYPVGKDLNRSFPGNNHGSLSSRMAYVIMQKIVPLIDYGIDFHTGGASKANFPHLRTDFSDPKNLELANAFSPQIIVNSKAPDKTFRKAAGNCGKKMLTFEGGESLRFDEFSIQEGIAGIARLMNYLGMRHSTIPDNFPHVLSKNYWTRARYSGLFRSSIQLGQKIKKNQVLGSITDPFGNEEINVKAAANGYVIGINHECVINKGDALIHVGVDSETNLT